MKTKLRVTIIAIAAALAFGACSGGDSGETGASDPVQVGEQSVEEACALIYEGQTRQLEDLDELTKQISPDGGDPLTEMQRITEENLQATTDSITNEEVLAVWKPAADLQLKNIIAIAAGNSDEVATITEELIEKYDALIKVCPNYR